MNAGTFMYNMSVPTPISYSADVQKNVIQSANIVMYTFSVKCTFCGLLGACGSCLPCAWQTTAWRGVHIQWPVNELDGTPLRSDTFSNTPRRLCGVFISSMQRTRDREARATLDLAQYRIYGTLSSICLYMWGFSFAPPRSRSGWVCCVSSFAVYLCAIGACFGLCVWRWCTDIAKYIIMSVSAQHLRTKYRTIVKAFVHRTGQHSSTAHISDIVYWFMRRCRWLRDGFGVIFFVALALLLRRNSRGRIWIANISKSEKRIMYIA